jgi:hypothetical protein
VATATIEDAPDAPLITPLDPDPDAPLMQPVQTEIIRTEIINVEDVQIARDRQETNQDVPDPDDDF